jgi:hypothetical protein
VSISFARKPSVSGMRHPRLKQSAELTGRERPARAPRWPSRVGIRWTRPTEGGFALFGAGG